MIKPVSLLCGDKHKALPCHFHSSLISAADGELVCPDTRQRWHIQRSSYLRLLTLHSTGADADLVYPGTRRRMAARRWCSGDGLAWRSSCRPSMLWRSASPASARTSRQPSPLTSPSTPHVRPNSIASTPFSNVLLPRSNGLHADLLKRHMWAPAKQQ